jgi:hypothetical protein
MKTNARLAWILAAALLTTSASGLAQKGPQDQAQSDRQRPANIDRTYDRDRMKDRDRAVQEDRQQAPDKSKAKDQAQKRDRDIYGYQLMTEQERNEYREQLKKAETNQERQQIVAEHREKMQARASEEGVNLEEREESE